ncbi:hypothetical protein [Mesorhizobium intechi]|uniref:hypothetical protein n=1 Tax=Mesorhizobium intechi TaxID=537601 RepID=UPI00142EE22C|nr:hypothetical protein [Mesorhizobium intechi]
MRADYRRSRIVSHLLKTTALTTLALGLSGVVAHGDPDRLWQPQIRAIVGADNNGGNAALEGFIPIKQTAESVLFLDVRAKHDFKDASGQDIGLGIRRIVNPDLMLGGYAYINLENYNSTQFTAATLGVEAIMPNFDAHVNVFVPIKGDSTDHSTGSTLSMVSNQLIEQISVLDHRDYAAWGIEGEIGAQVPVNLPDKHSLRLDIGGYHFEDPHGDDGSVTGAKAGFEYTIGDAFGSGTELVFAGEVRNDNRDDTQFAGSVRLNIPFNPSRRSDKTAAIGTDPVYPVSEGLRKRVNERVRGDIGVRIQSQEINGGSTTRVAINAATNAAFGKFYFADGGLAGAGTQADPTTLDDAVTKAGSGGFVVALGGNGNLTTAGVTLANGQTVIGGGESVTARLSGGGTATFNLGGSDGTIQGTNVANNVITLGTGNTLNGITITGGANGIFGNNAAGTTLTNVTVTGAGGNGAAFTGNSTTVSASNFTSTGNGLDGLHIEDSGTYNFTGTTLLQGNHDDGLDISGKGTYTFATVNALDNTDRGMTVQGTSIAGSFTTTGGTVSGNGGMAVFIDPITAHVVLDSISQTGGTSGVVLDHVSGSFTVNGATTISNTTGPAIAISDSPAAIRFGDVAISAPGGDGISFAGVNAAVVAGNVVISGLGIGTGLDFSGSHTNFTAQSLNITGTGAAGSIGIDLSSPTSGGATIGITDGGAIAGVDTGVRFGVAGSLANSANAEFNFGGGSIAGITASLDTRGLNQTLGHYAFGSTTFSGPQLFDQQNVIFVGGVGSSGDGSSTSSLLAINQADLNTQNNAIFVLVNKGSPIDAAGGFSLSDGQTLASFGNGRSFSLGGIPVNVTGDNVQHDQVVSDPGGAATLTNSGAGDVVTAANGNSLLDFNISGGGAVGISATGINGLTIQGVTVGNVATGLVLDGVTGTVTVNDLNVQSASQTGIALVHSSAAVDFTGNTTIANATNVALFANNFDGTATFDDLDITGGGIGVGIVGGSSGTLTFGNGSSIAGTSSNAFSITNSTPNVTYDGTISQTAAASAVKISNMTGGIATFGGKITASTGAANAIDLTGNAGGAFRFTGGLDLTADGGFAFSAVNGGTLSVYGPNNTVATGLGPDEKGIQIAGMTIGLSGVNFSSVTVDGSGGGVSTGIVITNTSGGNVNFADVDLYRISGVAISLDNIASGIYSFNGTTKVDTVVGGGSGFLVQNSAATVSVSNLVTTNIAGTDVRLANNTGTIGIGGTITNSGAGDGVVVSGGSAAITVSAGISSSAGTPGAAVKVDGTTGGSAAFSGAVTSTGTGNLFSIGSTLVPVGGAISFTGPTLSATGGGGAVVTGLAGTATLNVTAPLSITNSVATGLSVSGVASTASATFGAVTVSGAGGNGIDIVNDAGAVTFGTTSVTMGSTLGLAGINFAGTNANVSFGTTNVTLGAGANQTGIDFSGSSTTADFGVTTITGTGDLTSRGIDLSSTTGNKTITFQRGSSISNVGTGVDLARDFSTATSANANFTFGDGTSADGLQSSIIAASGGYTVNTIGLDPTLGNYDFDDVAFTGNANLASAVGGTIMVSQSGGVIAAGTDGLSKSVTTISVAAADAMLGTQTFAFVGTVDLSGTPFTLDSGQSIIGFGNNNAITTSGTVQPINVQGNLGASGGTVTGNEGVVTGTGDFLHLLGSNQVRDTAFNFNGASGSAFTIDQSAGGFNNVGGITIQGVTVSNVATGSTAFKVAGLDSNLSILDNNVNVAGTLLDANGGAGNITVTRGNLPNGGAAGTLTGGGVNLQNLTGSVTIGDGTLTNTGANTAFNVGGGSAIISYAGTINSNGTGAAASIQGLTGGSVTLSGDLKDGLAGAGGNIIVAGIDNGTPATVTFSGASKQIDSGTTDGVNLGFPGGFPGGTSAPNPDATINFTNGGLDITTTTGMGFVAIDSGTVTVTGGVNANKIAGGDGLVLAATKVGGGGVTFDSITSNASALGGGVVLNGVDLAGNVNIGGLTNTGAIGVTLFGITGTGVVNFTGTTNIDVAGNGIQFGGQIGTVNIANVAGSSLTVDGGTTGIAFDGVFGGSANIGGNSGTASIGATTSTTTVAIDVGGNTGGTLNYNGSVKVGTGGVVSAGGADLATLNLSGSIASTTSSTAFAFFGANGVYNISSTIAHTGGTGVAFNGTSQGTATFSGTSKTFSTGANDAIVRSAGTGTLAFTNGGLGITTGFGYGINASTTGAGRFSVAGLNNTITTTTGSALRLDGATVGADGVNFSSISVNGAGTGILLNNVSGGAINLGTLNLLGITSRGVDITGTLAATVGFTSLNIGLGAANAVGLDLNGAIVNAGITAGDFDVAGGGFAGTLGIDMAGTTGTGTIQLGNTDNSDNPGDQASTISNVARGVLFSSATNAKLVFGDGAGPAASSIATFGGGRVIDAVDTLPTSGDYNFNDVNFLGDTSNLSAIRVFYIDAAGNSSGLGNGSFLNPGSVAQAELSSANVFVLVDKTSGGVETIDIGNNSFDLKDGQALISFKNGDAAIDVSQLGVDTAGGASPAFHFTTIPSSTLVANPGGLDASTPILAGNGTATITLPTSGTGVITAGVQNVTVSNYGSGAGIVANAGTASNFVIRNNDIAAGGRALDFSTSGASANTLLLSIDGNTLTSTGSALAASFSGQNISTTDNSIAIRSFADNKVTGGTGSGIAFNNVRFDSNGAGGTVSAGTLGIGTAGARVQGNGLSFTNTSGTLDLGTLSLANNGGTGVLVNTKGAGTIFALNSSGGVVTTTNGPAFYLDPLTVNMTFSSVSAVVNSVASGITFDGVAGTFTVTGATSVSNTSGFGIDATNANTGTFNFNTLTVNNTSTTGGGIHVQTGTLNVTGLANIDTASGIGLLQAGGATSFTGGLTIDTTSGTGIVGTGGTMGITASAAAETINATGGQAINLSGVAATIALDSTSSGGGSDNVVLSGVSGTVGLGTGALGGASGDSFVVFGGTAVVTYGGNITQANNAALVNVSGGNAGTLTFSTGTLSATNGTGLQFDNADGTYNFNGITTLNGGDAGVDIINGSGGTFSFAAGTSITSPSGTAFNVVGGTASVTYSGNITQANNAATVAVTAHSGGTITFQTGTLSATNGTGLQFSNADGIYNFNGTTTLNGGDAGVDITNGSGGTFTFGSGTTIANPSGVGFLVSGGTSTVTYNGTVSKSSTGKIVDISGVTGGAIALAGNLTASGAVDNGIYVHGNTGGTFTFSGGTKSLTTGAFTAVDLATNGGATINFTGGGLASNTTSGTGFSATGGGTVSVTGAGNSITTTSGTAVNLDTVVVAPAGVNFATTTKGAGGGSAVIMDTVTGTGTVALGSGSLVGGNAAVIRIGDGAGGANTGGTAGLTYSGTITSGTGQAIDIEDRAAGAQNITLSGTITHNVAGVNGIRLDDNAAGTITFSGASKAITSGTAIGVNLTDNAGATINFTGGGLVITTTSGNGFNATGAGPAATTGGTINVTGTGNTINSSTGTALNVVNTTIGASNLVFQSITSTGSSGNAGIVVDNTGSSGGLSVTGTGGAGTGGTISNKTGADILNGTTPGGNTTSGTGGTGIFLRNTANVSLASMQLNDFSNFAVYGKTVTGFTMTGTTINGVNGNNNAGNVEESAIRFDNLLGTASITGSSISGGAYSNIAVWNTSGTLNRLTMSGNTFGLINASIGNDNIDFTVYNSATANVTLDSNTFSGTRSDFFEAIANNNATMDVVATNNTFHNGQAIVPGGGTAISVRSGSGGNTSAATTTFNIANNIDTDGGANAFDTVGIFVAKGQDLGTMVGKITGNQLVGQTGKNSDGIFVRAAGASGTLTTLIQNNTITGWGNVGIHLQNNDGGVTMNASVFGNSVTAPGVASPFSGFFADNGATAGDTSIMNLVLGGTSAAQKNTFTAPGGAAGISLSNFNASTIFNLSRNGSAGGTAALVVTDDNNPFTPSNVNTSGGNGTITLVNTLPATPP